jgi:hypothetical protein
MQLEQGFGRGNAWTLPRQSYKLQIQEGKKKKKKKKNPTHFTFRALTFHILLGILEGKNRENEKMK